MWRRYEGRKRERHEGCEEMVEQHRERRGLPGRDISDKEIVERCIFSIVNEG